MSESISATYQYLLTHYGPLMTLKHVAEVMHSTPNGVRMSHRAETAALCRSAVRGTPATRPASVFRSPAGCGGHRSGRHHRCHAGSIEFRDRGPIVKTMAAESGPARGLVGRPDIPESLGSR